MSRAAQAYHRQPADQQESRQVDMEYGFAAGASGVAYGASGVVQCQSDGADGPQVAPGVSEPGPKQGVKRLHCGSHYHSNVNTRAQLRCRSAKSMHASIGYLVYLLSLTSAMMLSPWSSDEITLASFTSRSFSTSTIRRVYPSRLRLFRSRFPAYSPSIGRGFEHTYGLDAPRNIT